MSAANLHVDAAGLVRRLCQIIRKDLQAAISPCQAGENFQTRRRLELGSWQEALLPELSSPFQTCTAKGQPHPGVN